MSVLKAWLATQLPHHPHVRLRVWDADTSDHMKSRQLIRRLTDKALEEHPDLDFRISLLPNRHIQSDVRFDWPDLASGEKYPEGRCKAGMMLAVLADGTITPCCLDGAGVIALGNLNQHNLDEIIATPRYKDFLQGMNDRKPSEALCRSCSYKLRFD